LAKTGDLASEIVPKDMDAPYNIGKSQNHPVTITQYLHKHDGDPAVKVSPLFLNDCYCLTSCQGFIPKLKEHILPHIKALLAEEWTPGLAVRDMPGCQPNLLDSADDVSRVFIKSDCMYQHHLLRINHTTYDVRHSQDNINPSTSHQDIMMLVNNAPDGEGSEEHPFCYARVLGVFHVNVIYTGTGMVDYVARRLDFLWVRWYRYSGAQAIGWKDYRLDTLSFPPVAHDHSFGFVDPRDVIRGCHTLPAFKRGKSHADGISISRCAGDGMDWRNYLVNR
jgi:hypothetical protein